MHSWFKNYEKIRANTWRLFCVFRIFRVKDYLTQRRKERGALCPFVLMSKKLHTELTEYTETLLRVFCGCLRRLRETIPLRTALVEISAH